MSDAAVPNYDLLTWFRNPNWKTSHLEGTNQAGGKVIQHCHDTGHNLIFTKTDNGFPWDVYSYDNTWIYDWITENGWTSASDYTAYNPKITGIPRFWNGNQSWVNQHGSCPVDFYTNCNVSKTGADTTKFQLTGPFNYNFGGNVGTLPTIRVDYWWSPSDLEYRFLTQQHGWVLWQYLHAGKLVQWSNHNQVVAGSVTPVFKCFSIP